MSTARERFGLHGVPLEDPGRWSRLVRKPVKANAYREINNLLVDHPIDAIPPGAVDGLLASYGLSRPEAHPELVALYGKVLRHAARDREISEAESVDLARIRLVLGLSDGDVRELAGEVLRGAFAEAVGDERLTDEEQGRLQVLADRLRLPEDIVKGIHGETAGDVYRRLFNAAIEDRRLTPEEDAQFEALATSLGLKIEHEAATANLLDRFRLLWRIEQGELPDVPVSLRLKPGERCHAAVPASLHESRRVTRAIRYSGPSVRVPIMKGVSWRLGQVNVGRDTQDVLTQIDTGTLYITNRRLLFDGATKSTSIGLDKILNFEAYSDGLKIEKDRGKDQVFMHQVDGELVAAVLGATLRAAG